MRTTPIDELGRKLQEGVPIRLVDVRTPAEYRAVHARGAVSVPLDQLEPERLAELPGEGPIYVICRSGARSEQACRSVAESELADARSLDVVSVDGGTQAWEAAGLPIERGQGAIDLERQVRIAAGALVVIGAVLGFTVAPAWHALSAFVGAGLMFAGITNTCAMGMALARMPWNR